MDEESKLQAEFDAAYWAHQPPELRERLSDDLIMARMRAAALAELGFIVDVPIMVWGWDPYLVMKHRKEFGYTWVPSALQPPPGAAPGAPVSATGVAYDPNAPPPGSIKVSTNPADYPPFNPLKAAVAAPQDHNPIGANSVGNLYYSMPPDTHRDGEHVTDVSRGEFVKHVVQTPFGWAAYWEKIA